MVADGS